MKDYYEQLIKPFWAPPAWIFGPVWTILYILIFVTYFATFYYIFTKKIPWYVGLVLIFNLVLNLLFTPIQFGLKNNLLASIDVILLLVTIVISIYFIFPYNKLISLLQLPYLIWVSFAMVLQLTITYMNWRN